MKQHDARPIYDELYFRYRRGENFVELDRQAMGRLISEFDNWKSWGYKNMQNRIAELEASLKPFAEHPGFHSQRRKMYD